MVGRTPSSTRTYTLLPYATLFRSVAVPVLALGERRIAHLRQFDLVARARGQRGRRLDLAVELAARPLGPRDAVVRDVVHPLERAAHAHRPTHRRDIQGEHVGDLVEQFERRPPFAIDLVAESDDRHAAQPAHPEHLARLRPAPPPPPHPPPRPPPPRP